MLLFELRDQLQDTRIGVRPLRPSRPLSDHPITAPCWPSPSWPTRSGRCM
ncbi:MAG: hypothetical protein HC853_09470 [Anaerolineae bacterium]|nr:hypothetical protein [Anaerolineae bacterium]